MGKTIVRKAIEDIIAAEMKGESANVVASVEELGKKSMVEAGRKRRWVCGDCGKVQRREDLGSMVGGLVGTVGMVAKVRNWSLAWRLSFGFAFWDLGPCLGLVLEYCIVLLYVQCHVVPRLIFHQDKVRVLVHIANNLNS